MRPIVVGLLLLSPGCMGSFLAQCGTSSTVSWTQPGLFSEFAPFASNETAAYFETPASPGLSFEDENLSLHWPNHTLGGVLWMKSEPVEQGEEDLLISLRPQSPRPVLVMEAPVAYDEEKLRPHVYRFLENTTKASSADKENLFRALFASRTEAEVRQEAEGVPEPVSYAYIAPLATQLRVSELYDRLGGIDNSTTRPTTPSESVLLFGAWTMRFQLPVRELRIDLENATLVARVGAHGRTEATVPESVAGDPKATQEWLRRVFAEAGLSAPTFDDYEAHHVVCA